jgi:hypothetical protein
MAKWLPCRSGHTRTAFAGIAESLVAAFPHVTAVPLPLWPVVAGDMLRQSKVGLAAHGGRS